MVIGVGLFVIEIQRKLQRKKFVRREYLVRVHDEQRRGALAGYHAKAYG